MNWKSRLDNIFVAYVQKSMLHPLLNLLIPIVVIAVMGLQLTKLEQDTAIETFFDPESELFMLFDEFRGYFGRDEFFMVMIETDDFYSSEFLKSFSELHRQLEKIPNVDTVDSLVNARYIESIEDDMNISELLEYLPETEEEFTQLKQSINNNPVYLHRLISEDHHYVAIMIKPIPYKFISDDNGNQSTVNLLPAEMHDVLKSVKQAVTDIQAKTHFSKSLKVGGAAAVGITMNQALEKDFQVFTGASMVLVILFLSIMFRRLSGVVLPMLVINAGLIITMGMMPALGFPIQVTTAILPSFLLAVCVGSSVHILSYFYTNYDNGEDKISAMSGAIRHTGVPMLFTSLTTAVGLLSFGFSDLVPVAGLGLFGAIGAIVAFFATIIMLPSLVALFPMKVKTTTVKQENIIDAGIHQFLRLMVSIVMKSPLGIVIGSLVIMGLGIWATTQLPFSNDTLEWFDPEVEVYQAIKESEKVLAGSAPVEIMIDTGETGGAVNPELLKKIDTWLNQLHRSKFHGVEVGSITSVIDLIKETNRGLNANNSNKYTIPDQQELIAQELLMVEMDQADELTKYLDSDRRYIRITLIIPWIDSILFPAYIESIEQSFIENVGKEHKITITGLTIILGQFFANMIDEMKISYLAAGLLISVMMIILLGDLKIGLVSMIPNLLPIISLMGVMYIFDFKLDMFSMLIGSIAIGLSVDDTIHFMHGFRKNLQEHQQVEKAIESTIMVTGKALLTTSLVLCCGFLTYTLSSLNNLFNFGVLAALCTMIALLADLLLAPALMLLIYR